MKVKFTLINILFFLCVVAFGQVKKPSAKKTPHPQSTYKKAPLNKSSSHTPKNNTTTNSVTKTTDITGIWRGYFAQNSFGVYDDRYKFEIQIEQLPDDAVKGVTYSYKTTIFYGKATVTGIYFKSTKSVVINELKLIDLKIGDLSEPCLMKCDMDYEKMGDHETLTGTYTSRNVTDKADCGGGKVYLEKTNTTDFYKEDFLVKRENQKKKPSDLAKNNKSKLPTTTVKPKNSTPSNSDDLAKKTPAKPTLKPGAEGNLEPKVDKPFYTKPPAVAIVPAPPVEEPAKIKPIERPKPDVIRKRDNELIKTFYTSAKDIKIELYDNGEVDGDTITVYHNNELIVSKKRLTEKPITFTIHADANSPHHEFVMVAENLGSIPPNTALMIITAGGKRYETSVTSTEQKNAVVILEYKPDAP